YPPTCRSSRFTVPTISTELSWVSLSAREKTSCVRFDASATHWQSPLPSLNIMNTSPLLLRLLATHPLRVTDRPSLVASWLINVIFAVIISSIFQSALNYHIFSVFRFTFAFRCLDRNYSKSYYRSYLRSKFSLSNCCRCLP